MCILIGFCDGFVHEIGKPDGARAVRLTILSGADAERRALRARRKRAVFYSAADISS